MIPRDYITAWRAHAPWAADAQVEQDLVICRALLSIFTHPTPLPLRLKVEVNTREHFTEFGLRCVAFGVDSRWFSGACEINTYDLDELLGTKLRALYQRRKGRDLFDMATALSRGNVDPARVVAAFRRYMAEGGHQITRAEFERNLAEKLEDRRFLSDMPPLLAAGQECEVTEAAKLVMNTLLPLLA